MANYLITGFHGEPHLTAENDRGLYASIFGGGRYVLYAGERLRAERTGTYTLRLHDGKLLDGGALAGIPAGEYIDFEFSEVGQGRSRIDLIVFKYSRNVDTQIETGSFEIVKGVESSGDPVAPTVTQNDIQSGGATIDYMPLYRVLVSGLAGITVEQMFEIRGDIRSEASSLATNARNAAEATAKDMSQTNARKFAYPVANYINLIPNSEFSLGRVVNTKGKTTFHGPGECIDGWWIPEGVLAQFIGLGAGYLLISNNSDADQFVYTKLPKGILDTGNAYTGNIHFTYGGMSYSLSATADLLSEFTPVTQVMDANIFLAVRIGADHDEIGINVPAGVSCNVFSCKLFAGAITSTQLYPDESNPVTMYYAKRDPLVNYLHSIVTGMQPKLLWTNPSPDAAFVSTSVNMDLAGYTHVVIEAQTKSAAGDAYTEHFLISAPAEGGAEPKRGCLGVFNCTGWRRTVNVYTDRVYFGSTTFYTVTADATNQGTTDNLKLIPYRIYGIRRMYV